MEKCIYYLTVIDSYLPSMKMSSKDIRQQIVITTEERLKHTDIRKIGNYIYNYISVPMELCPGIPEFSFDGKITAYFSDDSDIGFEMHITNKKGKSRTAETRWFDTGMTIQDIFNTFLSNEVKCWNEVIYSCYNMNELSEQVLMINIDPDKKYKYLSSDFFFSVSGTGCDITLELCGKDTDSDIQKIFYMIDPHNHSVYLYTKNDKLYTNALINEGIYMKILENDDSDKIYGIIKLCEREMVEEEQEPTAGEPRKTLIMFEGIDGSGKSTLKNNFEDYLRNRISQCNENHGSYENSPISENPMSIIKPIWTKDNKYNFMSISPLKELIPGMKDLLENKGSIPDKVRDLLITSKYVCEECDAVVKKDGLFDEIIKISDDNKSDIIIMDRFFNSLVYNLKQLKDFENVTDFIKDRLINHYGFRLITVYCYCPAKTAYYRISERDGTREVFEDLERLQEIEDRYNEYLSSIYDNYSGAWNTSKYKENDILINIPTDVYNSKESLLHLIGYLEELGIV